MIMRGDYMKSKQYQPMNQQEAVDYICCNQYDNPRKLICTARKLAADVCIGFDREMTDMLQETIHNEDYALAYGLIVRAFEQSKEPIPAYIRAFVGYPPFWGVLLLFLSAEIDDMEALLDDLSDDINKLNWQRQALRELIEKEAQK